MSVFTAIKEKLTGRTDLTHGLRQMTIGPKKMTDKKEEHAGFTLLNRYETSWSTMHKLLQDSIKNNKVTDAQIMQIAVFCGRERAAVTNFYSELMSLPDVLVSVKALVSQMHELEEQLFAVEDLLVQLEDLTDVQGAVTLKQKETSLVEDYKLVKKVQCEENKVQMARKHMEDVEAYESNLQETLRERQKVFEHAYKEEIQHYKESGETMLKPTTQTEKLEQVEVAFDDGSALEDFLTDNNSNSPV